MRNIKTFIQDAVKKPPLLFPLVALFHFFALIFALWNVHSSPFGTLEWLQPLWILAYTICWVFICDMRKWAAIGYILLTSVDIILYVSRSSNIAASQLTMLFPTDVLFCFFVLFYYRRFY